MDERPKSFEDAAARAREELVRLNGAIAGAFETVQASATGAIANAFAAFQATGAQELFKANCGVAKHPLRALRADGTGEPRQVACLCGDQVWEVPGSEELERLRATFRILSDLDRCQHGRHRIDSCFSCPGGQSAGNPHLPAPGEVVGYNLAGEPYYVPSGDRSGLLASTSQPDAWRRPGGGERG